MLKGPPEPTLIQRANSYSDFHHVSRADMIEEANNVKLKSNQELSTLNSNWEQPLVHDWYESGFEDDLLDASQEEFM